MTFATAEEIFRDIERGCVTRFSRMTGCSVFPLHFGLVFTGVHRSLLELLVVPGVESRPLAGPLLLPTPYGLALVGARSSAGAMTPAGAGAYFA
jgi:hypothetical protein